MLLGGGGQAWGEAVAKSETILVYSKKEGGGDKLITEGIEGVDVGRVSPTPHPSLPPLSLSLPQYSSTVLRQGRGAKNENNASRGCHRDMMGGGWGLQEVR